MTVVETERNSCLQFIINVHEMERVIVSLIAQHDQSAINHHRSQLLSKRIAFLQPPFTISDTLQKSAGYHLFEKKSGKREGFLSEDLR